MVDTRSHSFEEASRTGNYIPSVSSHSRSGSSQGRESIRITEFATINLPFFESTASQLPRTPRAQTCRIPISSSKENRLASPERGRSRVRTITSSSAVRSPLRSTVSPDRFIPKRDFVEPKSATFRVAKLPQQLSPQERLFRRLPLGDDPFLPANYPRTPTRGRQRPVSLQRIPRQRPHLVTELTTTNSSNTVHQNLTQTSLSAVWNVGGATAARGGDHVAPSSTNSMPTISSNRTLAPNFEAHFLPKKPRCSEFMIHESRLALALGIDPTNRLLSTSLRCLEAPLSPTSPDFERLSPFVWKDNAWKKVERENCEY